MARVHGLIRWACGLVVCVCLALLWQPARATIPAGTPQSSYGDKSFFAPYPLCAGLGADGFSTPAAACSHMGQQGSVCGNLNHANDHPRPSYTTTGTSVSGSTCTYSFSWTFSDGSTGGSSTSGGPLDVTTSSACPANSTLTGSSCTCNTGYVEDSTHTSCISSDQSACNLLKGTAYWSSTLGTPSLGAQTCLDDGCYGTWQSLVTYTDKTNGKVTTEGSVLHTGGPCAYTPQTAPDQPVAAKDACPGGQVGTVNGVTICAAKDPATNVISSTSTSSTASSSATAASGAASGAAPAASSASSGTTTTTTTCDGGNCTTSSKTTTLNPDGSTTTSTQTATATISSYCKDHPTEAMCKVAGTFSGSCSAGFSCSGDAVQCAAAQAVWSEKCALVDGVGLDGSPEQQAFAAAKAASGSGVPSTDVVISSSSFDSSNALGVSASCIADDTVTVWGTAVPIRYSTVCPHLQMLGTVLLGIAWIMAGLIVGKGVKG